MLRSILDIKSFSGVGWNSRPEVKLTGGPTYHEIFLRTNLLPAQFRVELIINGDPRISLTGTQLLMLESFKKIWTQAGEYVLPLGDLAGRSIEGQMIGGLETSPSDNIILRVYTVAEPNPNTQGAVTLSAEAKVSAPMQNELGADLAIYWPRIVEVTFAAGQTGKNIHDTLPQGPGMRLLRAHFNGDVTRLEVKKGPNAVSGAVVWQRDADRNEYELKRQGRAPQAGYFHADFVESGFIIAEMMKLDDVPLTTFDIYVGAAGNIPILLETLERVK